MFKRSLGVLATAAVLLPLTGTAHATADVHVWYATIPVLQPPGLPLPVPPPVPLLPRAAGTLCTFVVTGDPTAEPNTVVGVLLGGPVILPASGTLNCRIQNGVATHTGAGPAVTAAGDIVFTAGPSPVALFAGPEDQLYLCAEFTDNATGTTLYWDGPNDRWSTSSGVHCNLASHTIVPVP